jgi:hypothetical protein
MRKILIGILLGLSLGISISIFAWVNPSQNPPSGGGVLQTSNTGLTINTSTYFISGNVGIGTTAPTQKLHVAGGSAVVGYIAGSSGGVFIAEPAAYGQPAIQGVTSTFAPGTLAINPVGGNVGIGTTAPVQKLHVEGNTYISGNVGIGTTEPLIICMEFILQEPAEAQLITSMVSFKLTLMLKIIFLATSASGRRHRVKSWM